MRIGLVAPPFIPVPPVRYGGTELFVANLAEGLQDQGHDVTVYANGDSRVACRLKWRYPHAEWPLSDPLAIQLKNADHAAWAVQQAGRDADIIHLNDITGIPLTRFVDRPVVHTLHHPREPAISALYRRFPAVSYVAISASQARRDPLPHLRIVHHGIAVDRYIPRTAKQDYVVFLGRLAPCKGAHVAIEAARRAGVSLKIAGEVQPLFRDYWKQRVKPHVDGRRVEYLGEANHAIKNELLAGARALLFPIEWEEPFGLVMIEAMACGTPVLAFAGGSVKEIVRDGVSGWICGDVDDMAGRIASLDIDAASCRAWVESHFSVERMVERYLTVYDAALTRAEGPAVPLET